MDRAVVDAAPVIEARGVTRNFLLQGVFDRPAATLAWDRFEILAVDADW